MDPRIGEQGGRGHAWVKTRFRWLRITVHGVESVVEGINVRSVLGPAT
jgi:hypothetical protein